MSSVATEIDLDPRYPIGKHQAPTPVTAQDRDTAIQDLAELPARLREALAGLTDTQLDTPYREGGWTVRQVAHHLSDAHMSAFLRTKQALTEDQPTITPHDWNQWAVLPDSTASVDLPLSLLEGLHGRWVILLRGLTDEQWSRGLIHPRGTRSVQSFALTYGWHSRHHVAHITTLRQREGW